MDLNPGVSNPKGKGSVRNRNKGQNAGGSVEAEEDSESESESSSSSCVSQSELYNFRQAWEADLKKMTAESQLPSSSPLTISQGGITTSMAGVVSTSAGKDLSVRPEANPAIGCNPTTTGKGKPDICSVNNEEQAKQWFLQGVKLERKGELYDAVKFYKRAMQLIPDIEYRVNASYASNDNSYPSSKIGTPDDSDDERNQDEDNETVDDEPLVKRFLRQIESNDWQFFEKAKNDSKVHLRDIPTEVVSYILRWVISKELDVRSLDVLSGTSKGFYCLCRDEQLWKMSCERIWRTCHLLNSGYSTYREMFLKRNRVRFDGCYISRITYIRAGENSFQDQSYRPWHLVEYYRYIRFFPDGHIYFLTSADHPSVIVGGLKERLNPRNSATMRGSYCLCENNIVTAIVTKPGNPTSTHKGRKREISDFTTFHLDLEITGLKERSSWILKWMNYSVRTQRGAANNQQLNNNLQNMNLQNNPDNNTGSLTSFELSPSKFPLMYFSRVKSFTTKAESVLE